MQLTGKEIIESGVLTGVDMENAVQQQGVDIRVDKINRLVGIGWIPAGGEKTTLPAYEPVQCCNINPESDEDGKYFSLDPGYYEVIFMEGCNIPRNLVINNIKSRSSLVRCGSHIECGQFDAGFSTNHMGCFLKVERHIFIDHGARIAQVQVFETNPVEEGSMYNGQWQHDKQRN